MSQAQIVTELGQAYAAGNLSFRNLLINGDFAVWQRGASFSAGGLTTDRWTFALAAPNTGTLSYVNNPWGSIAAQLTWANGGGAGQAGLWTNLEEMRWFSNQDVMLSFEAMAVGAQVSIASYFDYQYASAADVIQGVQIDTVPVGSFKKILHPYHTLDLTSKTINASSFFRVALMLDNGSIPGLPRQASGTVQIRNVQLERGLIATPMEHRPVGLELLLCQRYYQVIGQLFTNGYGPNGASIFCHVALPVTMRTTPGDPVIAQVGKSNSTDVIKDSSGANFLRVQSSIVSGPANGWAAASATLSAEL